MLTECSRECSTFDSKGPKSGNLINLVYHIERTISEIDARSPCTDQKWLLVADFNGYSMLNRPSFECTRLTIKISKHTRNLPSAGKPGLVDSSDMYWA